MVKTNYPRNWDDIREDVLDDYRNQCANCNRSDSPLEVHHVVPVGQGGSHQRSNLVPLCPQCHEAAHGEVMAPRIRWYTNGRLTKDEFTRHHRLWKQLRRQFGAPRYDPDEECVYIPISDADKIAEHVAS